MSGSFTIYNIPALLQTEEYARKIIDDIEPNMDADVSLQWVKSGICYEQVHVSGNWQRYRIARE